MARDWGSSRVGASSSRGFVGMRDNPRGYCGSWSRIGMVIRAEYNDVFAFDIQGMLVVMIVTEKCDIEW